MAEIASHPDRDYSQPNLHGLQVWIGIDSDMGAAKQRLAKGMQDFYRTPFSAFEKYSPWGSPADVADFLRPYIDSGCRLFNIMPVARTEREGIDAVAEIRRRLHEQ